MKSFKDFMLEMKKGGSGVIPAPIHFRHVGDAKNNIEEALIHNWADVNDNNHIPRRADMDDVLGRPKLSKEQHHNIKSYTTSSFRLNHFLVHNQPLEDRQKEQIKHLDSAIDNNRIKTRVHTYSGVGFDPTKHMDSEGRLHSPAYISTSHDKRIATGFAVPVDGIHHIIHLHVDAHGPAMNIPNDISGLHEHEILLKRGVTLQHHGHTDYDAANRRYRIHKMSVVNKE